jgi:Ca-activated chloride channel family protein
MIMDDTSLHFAQPFWIIAGLVACAGVVGLFIRFDRRREADLTKLIHPRFRQRLTEGFSPGMRNLKRGLWLLAVLLVFTAVARPQKGYEWREVKRKGIDILFAVDTSRSMLADDLSPNRLERARLGIIDFVSRLEGDRVGLIPFAGSAFALCPLTLDYEAFRESLNALDTDLIPRQGTDLASAIKEAERLFKENGNNHRVLVLLTDGEDLQGDVIDAAKAAAKNGMAIYTIGVGSPGGSTIPLVMRNGRKDFVRDETGSVVRTTLDETTLKKIATETNALYVPLGRGAEGLNTIYQEKLRLVPKSERDQRMERIPLERFEWPLGAAIFLLLLEFFITDRRRAKKARPLPSAARRHKIVPQATALIGLAFILSGALKTVSAAQDPRRIYNEGTQAYTNGDFAKASESLRSSLRTQDLALQQRSYYNLGNTLYRTGQGTLEKDPEATIKTWEESLKAYQDALFLNAADKDADYNKVLVEKKLEELKNQQKQDDKKDDQDKKDDSEKEDGKDQKDRKDSKDGKDPKDGEKPKDGKDSKEGEKPGDKQDSKDGKDPKDGEKPEDAKDSKDGKKPGEEKSPQDGKDAKEGDEKSGEKQQGEMSNARAEKQEMTAEEAKQLLEALRQDERMVIPIPQQPRGRMATPDNSTKGKTW